MIHPTSTRTSGWLLVSTNQPTHPSRSPSSRFSRLPGHPGYPHHPGPSWAICDLPAPSSVILSSRACGPLDCQTASFETSNPLVARRSSLFFGSGLSGFAPTVKSQLKVIPTLPCLALPAPRLFCIIPPLAVAKTCSLESSSTLFDLTRNVCFALLPLLPLPLRVALSTPICYSCTATSDVSLYSSLFRVLSPSPMLQLQLQLHPHPSRLPVSVYPF